jgi:hypothetical protein
MIKTESVAQLLEMDSEIKTAPEAMASEVCLTVFPFDPDEESSEVLNFYHELRNQLEAVGVEIIPFEDALIELPLTTVLKRAAWMVKNNLQYLISNLTSRQPEQTWMGVEAFKNLLKRKRVKPGISVVAVGDHKEGELPMDYTDSFRRTSVITLMEMPEGISENSDFEEHFQTALDLFSNHMTNIVIGVSEDNWLLYNFNASHPFFPRDQKFKENVLSALIPKIHAPIKPPKLKNFTIKQETFEANDEKHRSLVMDMLRGGQLFGKTNLYPSGKRLEELSFRNSFYKWIGRIHIDKRNGMSFGFLARQMPTRLPEVKELDSSQVSKKQMERGYVRMNDEWYLLFKINDELLAISFPDVWVLTQRSGSDKTNMHPVRDLVKLGLTDAGLHLHTPQGVRIKSGYRPSFDTRVILAHAIGNALAASLFEHFNTNQGFVENFTSNGMALAHWHGYFHPERVPDSLHQYGIGNPHVACSSPQSAVYALQGKMQKITDCIEQGRKFTGDIHIEPHHGVNISYYSLQELGKFLCEHTEATKLGNKYLQLNKKSL